MKQSLRCQLLIICFSVGFLFLSMAISPHSLQKIALAQDQPSGSSAMSMRDELSDVKDELTQLPKYSPNSISQSLTYSHFIPMGPLSHSPGNQVKLVLSYNVTETSLMDTPINAVMEIYSANQSLVRTSSLPQPLNLTNPEGTITLATTLQDNNLKNITALAMITDDEKAIPISNALEARLNLGEMSSGG